jgi:hypothetical protein
MTMAKLRQSTTHSSDRSPKLKGRAPSRKAVIGELDPKPVWPLLAHAVDQVADTAVPRFDRPAGKGANRALRLPVDVADFDALAVQGLS